MHLWRVWYVHIYRGIILHAVHSQTAMCTGPEKRTQVARVGGETANHYMPMALGPVPVSAMRVSLHLCDTGDVCYCSCLL